MELLEEEIEKTALLKFNGPKSFSNPRNFFQLRTIRGIDMESPEEQGFPYNRTDERCQSILIISLWLIGSVLIDFFLEYYFQDCLSYIQ